MCTSNGIMDDIFGVPNVGKIAIAQAQQAQQAQAQRQRQINATINKIKAIFSDPNLRNQIAQIANDQYLNWQDQISRARAEAERNLKANMARTGMIGSSPWEQQLAALQASDQQALAQAQANKDAIIRQFNSNLAGQQNQLIQQAQNGLSATQAAQLANSSIGQALADAAATQIANNWTQFFDGLGAGITSAAKSQGQKAAAAGYTQVPVGTSSAGTLPVDQQIQVMGY